MPVIFNQLMRFNLIFLLLFGVHCLSQQPDPLLVDETQQQKQWVDSIYSTLSLDEKIGQLFFPMVFSKKDDQHFEEIKNLIQDNHIGGLIFSQGTPHKQTAWLNSFQSYSKIPLLVTMDAEWGVAMRLDSVVPFPWSMTLGASRDHEIIKKIGRRLGEQERLLGVQMSFSPVADINTNPLNPIIGNRSFGENHRKVAKQAVALMEGHHQAEILTSAKHFPGHGDTKQDSHLTLPKINFSKDRIESKELYPFKKLIENNVSAVMVAHLNVPALTGSDSPASLSRKLVTGLLKEKLGFNGLVVTDALNMKGANNNIEENIDLAAFIAGNDLLLISLDIPKGIQAIKQAYEKSDYIKIRLEESLKKILKAKFKVGLTERKLVDTEKLYEKLNTLEDTLLIREAFSKSITLIKNNNDLIPLDSNQNYSYIQLGDAPGKVFSERLYQNTSIEIIDFNTVSQTMKSLKKDSKVIISFHRSDINPWKDNDFSEEELKLIEAIALDHEVILNIFVNPYALGKLKSVENIDAILISYQNNQISQEISADILAGVKEVKGVLPVSINPYFKEGDGIQLPAKHLFIKTDPSTMGFDLKKLNRIDSFAQKVIDSAMTPGMQIFIARKGKMVYQKSFGHHTYQKNVTVKNHHVYDLASLTKILATLPLIIQARENNSFTLESKLSELLPELLDTNKGDLSVKSVLSHYSGLSPWIPFYKKTLNRFRKPKRKYYRKIKRGPFNLIVTNQLFLKESFGKEMKEMIYESPLLDSIQYKYSDLPFYLFKYYFEGKYSKPLDELADENLFKPLGLKRTFFNPRGKIPLEEIVPSEDDNYFRYTKLRGFVHDMGAAMQGGVGGHAGLFSNAIGVGKIMQLYLNKGFIDGKKYFTANSFDQFNQCYYCDKGNRRGVGFDKPQLSGVGSTCGCVDLSSFGHMGFTGTYAWADPEKDLIFVFLSNRTYPSMSNNLLGDYNIRTRMQKLVYEALIK